MKRALVTGAAGFLGRNLVQELLRQDYEVFALLREPDRFPMKHENLHLIACGMDEYASLGNREELRGVRVLFHLAWAGVSGPDSTDYALQLNNIKCACDLQTAAQALGIPCFAFADSIMEFEYQKAFDAGHFLLGLRSTYAVAKRTARELLQLRCANAGMTFVPLLISNVYGPGENSPRLVNTAIRALLAREHMSFTPSEQLYDFIYITDAVRDHLNEFAALSHGIGAVHEGHGSTDGFVRTICRLMGRFIIHSISSPSLSAAEARSVSLSKPA